MSVLHGVFAGSDGSVGRSLGRGVTVVPAAVAVLLVAVVGLQLVPVVGLFAGQAQSDAVAMAAPEDEEWRYQTGADVETSPTVVDGTVYVGADDNKLHAVDAADGSRKWTYQAGSNVESSPTVVDGVVYVGADDEKLHAVDATDGSRKWTYQTGSNVDSSPTVADGTVYVGSDDNNLYALNATDGSRKWTYQTGDYVDSSPTVADGVVYVGSRDGNLYGFDTLDGSIEFIYESGSLESSPTVADGTVYAGSDDDNLYALNAANVGAESRGSRVLLGTLGHNDRFVADGSLSTGGSDDADMTDDSNDADIIDGSEQPTDGAIVDPADDVELAVDVSVDGNATVEFYDYETGNPDNDPLIGNQSVGEGESTPSTDWNSGNRSQSEQWYVVLKDSSGTRDIAGPFAFSAGGTVVARDGETGEIISDRTVRFNTTYPNGSEAFDRKPGVFNLSEVNAEEDERIRIEVKAQNYYERTVTVWGKGSDADVYLERGETWAADPATDDPENTANADNDPDRYLSRFTLRDGTSRYPPPNTTLALRTDVDGDGKNDLVHRSSFGADNRVGARVKQDRQYQLVIENDAGDTRRLGAWTALGDELVELQVRGFDFDIPEAGASGYTSQASIEEGNDIERISWQFSDPDEATFRLEVAIYERDNRSNGLLNQTYNDLGNASYTQLLTGNQTGKAWVVELSGTRNGESFTSREVVGETDLAPGIPLDPFYQEMFAGLLLLVLAGVFGGVRAEAGAIIVPMTAGVLFWMEWLPGAVTAGAILVALFVAILYRIRATPQPGVR